MIAAPNVLLMGPAGTGKTYSIATLVESGVEVFYVGMENGLESLLGYWADAGKPIPANLHWNVIEAPKASIAELMAMTETVNKVSFDALTKMSDKDRQKYDQMIRLYACLNDFEDQRTGKKFGSVEDWDNSKALVIDGLTGVSQAAMATVVGGKVVRSMPDWMLAQNLVEGFLRKLCNDTKCWFILISHIEREKDEVLGGIKIMPSTLGSKLAPKIAPMFSDVVLTVREGNKWSWDCANSIADVKARNLPWTSNINPTFKQIFEKWSARAKAAAN